LAVYVKIFLDKHLDTQPQYAFFTTTKTPQIAWAQNTDEDKKIVEAYGVWGQKSFMGRKYMGVFRVTFLIGPDGVIKKIWPKVKPEEHAEEVLAAI